MDTELGALAERAAGFDFAAMGLNDSMGEGQSEASAFFAGGKERTKYFWKSVGRDAFAVVLDADDGVVAFASDGDVDGALDRNGLDSVEHEIEDDLLDQRGVMCDRRKRRVRGEYDFHLPRANLLLGEHDGLLDRDIQVSGVKCGRPRARVGEQIVQDVLDVKDFVLDVGENGAAGAFSGEFLAHDVDNAGDAGERIANFMGESGGEFAEGGQVLGAAHFAAVEVFDFEAVALELLHHFVELAAESADVVAALCEHYPGGEIAAADAGDGVHEVF